MAECLDAFDPPVDSDLGIVINDLRLIPTEEKILEALDQLQPSQFTSLAIAQGENTMAIKELILSRDNQSFLIPSCQDSRSGSADFWSTATSTYVQLSVIREKRFRGDTEKALFNGSCPMTLIGLYPSRTLGALNVGVDLSFCENRKLSLYYRGKYCDDYRENSLNLEFAF